MGIQTWTEVTLNSLQNLWSNIIQFLPSLFGALVVVIIGFLVAAGLRALVEKLVKTAKLDVFLAKLGLDKSMGSIGYKLNSGKFLGMLLYWFVVIVFVLAATDILNLWGVSMFLRDIIAYVPNIVVAVLILLAAILLANFLKALVKASVMGARLHSPNFLGSIAWWAAIIFGFSAALLQLGIAVNLINTIITGIVVMLALAGGIAFGLGGKDYASHLLGKFREEMEEK